jgi:prolipoprotein diacylglyceryltransferase
MQVYRRAARIAREQQTDERFKQFVLSAVLVIIIAGALGGLAYVMFWMSKS